MDPSSRRPGVRPTFATPAPVYGLPGPVHAQVVVNVSGDGPSNTVFAREGPPVEGQVVIGRPPGHRHHGRDGNQQRIRLAAGRSSIFNNDDGRVRLAHRPRMVVPPWSLDASIGRCVALRAGPDREPQPT